MYPFLTKYGQTLAFGLGVLVTIIFLLIAFPNASEVVDPANPNKFNYSTSIFDFGIKGAIALTVLAVAAMVVFGVMQILSNPKDSKRGLIGLVVLIAVAVIAYYTADISQSAGVQTAIAKFEEANKTTFSEGNHRIVGGGIVISGILLVLAFLGLFGSEVRNFFK